MSGDRDDSAIDHAVAESDDKVKPGEVPVCEFTGGVKAPQTDGKILLAFDTPDGGTVAVRLSDEEWLKMAEQVEAVGL